jgi:hypothetical protein
MKRHVWQRVLLAILCAILAFGGTFSACKVSSDSDPDTIDK